MSSAVSAVDEDVNKIVDTLQQKQQEQQKAVLSYLNMLKSKETIAVLQFSKLIRLLGGTREQDLLNSLSPDILRLLPRLSSRTQQEFTHILHNMSQYPGFKDLGKQIFNHMLDSGLKADLRAYTSLINICTRSNDLEGALGIWELAKQRNIQPDHHLFASLLSACHKAGDEARAHHLIREMQGYGLSHNVYTYSALLSVYATTQNIRDALTTLHEMMAKGVEPNVWTFTTLINACVRANRLEDAFAIMPLMKKCRVSPNAHTYTALINACVAEKRLFDRAMALFERAKEESHLTVGLLTAALDACSHQGDLETASSILSLMKERKMEPNERTCTALFHLYSNAGKVDKMYDTLNMMTAKGIAPNIRHINVLLAACVKQEDVNKIAAVIDLTNRLPIKPDINTYTSFVFLYSRLQRYDKAFEVLDDAVKEGLKPDLIMYNALLEACVEANDPAHMLSFFDRMRSDGITPDLRSYRLAVREVRQCWEILPKNGWGYWKRLAAWGAFQNHTCLHLLRLANSHEAAEQICDFVRLLTDQHDLSPKEATYATMVRLCVDAQDKEGAQEIVRHMRYREVNLERILSIFISAACETGAPGSAEEMVRLMEELAGIRASLPDLEVLFHSTVSAGLMPAATRVLAALEARGASQSQLDQWRYALRTVADETRLREELAKQPRSRIPVRKYALFKSSLSSN